MLLTKEYCIKKHNNRTLFLSLEHLTNESLPILNQFLREHASDIEVLILCKTQLTTAPNVQGLNFLALLNLSENQLTAAPDVQGLNSLRNLNLSENQLTTAPDVQGLNSLKYLDLSKNQLLEIPSIKTYVPKLGNLHLSENPIDRILNEKGNSLEKKLCFLNIPHRIVDVKKDVSFANLKISKQDVLNFIYNYFNNSSVLYKEDIRGIPIKNTNQNLSNFSSGAILNKILEFLPKTHKFAERREKFIQYLDRVVPKNFELIEGKTVRQIAVEFLSENYSIQKFLNSQKNLTIMYDTINFKKEKASIEEIIHYHAANFCSIS